MIDPAALVRKQVRAMEPYEPAFPLNVLARDAGIAPDEMVKLDANENPYGPVVRVREALAALEGVHRYPDPESRILREALAEFHGVPFEVLVAGAGADELIDLSMRLVIEPGDRIVTCPPTFGMYSFDGHLNGAEVIEVPRRPDFRLDLAALKEAVSELSPKLLLLAHPNNPDGGLLKDEEYAEISSLPLLVLLDEAYIEFANGARSRLAEAASKSNLIVLRTFSKWAGLAGLRVGYGVFPRDLLPYLWRIKQPYTVSAAGSQAALAALKSRDEMEEVGRRIRAERERLSEALSSVSYLRPFPSQANFVLCRVEGRSAAELQKGLEARGIVIRYFDKPGLRQHVRISAGTPQDTDRLLTALRELE